jgi:hypothetical protein
MSKNNNDLEITRYLETTTSLKIVKSEKPRAIPFEDGKYDPDGFVKISEEGKKITFEIQAGNYNDHGFNGCYPVQIISFVRSLYEVYSKEHPSRENAMILTKLDEALLWDVKRTNKRHIDTQLHPYISE